MMNVIIENDEGRCEERLVYEHNNNASTTLELKNVHIYIHYIHTVVFPVLSARVSIVVLVAFVFSSLLLFQFDFEHQSPTTHHVNE